MQQEPHQLLVFPFADPLDEAVRRERHAQPVGREPVFRKAEVEERGHGDGGSAELLLLLGQVGAADEADGYLFAQGGEEAQHFRGDGLVVLLVGIVGFGGRIFGEGYSAGWC